MKRNNLSPTQPRKLRAQFTRRVPEGFKVVVVGCLNGFHAATESYLTLVGWGNA